MLYREHNIIEEWVLGYRATEMIFSNNTVLKPVFSSVLERKENKLEGKKMTENQPGRVGTVEGCRT